MSNSISIAFTFQDLKGVGGSLGTANTLTVMVKDCDRSMDLEVLEIRYGKYFLSILHTLWPLKEEYVTGEESR